MPESKTFTEHEFKSKMASAQIAAISQCFELMINCRDMGDSMQSACNKLYSFKWAAYTDAKNEGLQVELP